MTKTEKVAMINEAISKSELAIEKGAKVELRNNKIIYTKFGKCLTGNYVMKSTFEEIIFLLAGEDIRNIYRKLGKI